MAMFHGIRSQSNEIVWVNFDLVRTITRLGNYTRISFGDGKCIDTDAPPEDILVRLPDTHQSKY